MEHVHSTLSNALLALGDTCYFTLSSTKLHLPTAAALTLPVSNVAASRESGPLAERTGGATTKAWASGAAASMDAASTPAADEAATSLSRILNSASSISSAGSAPKRKLRPPSSIYPLRQSGELLERQTRYYCRQREVCAHECLLVAVVIKGFHNIKVSLLFWGFSACTPSQTETETETNTDTGNRRQHDHTRARATSTSNVIRVVLYSTKQARLHSCTSIYSSCSNDSGFSFALVGLQSFR